jgi:quercetin dioxygenase-like cupin family protein
MVAGQAPHKYSAGQALIVPMGAVHNARNDGPKDAVLIAVYSVEKDKPLRTPAPAPAH